jgi:hypothetical protein
MAEPMLIAKTPHTTCEAALPDWPTATGITGATGKTVTLQTLAENFEN